MAQLSIQLLGQFQVHLGGEPVTDFESDKARGLLAYLAVERDQLHRREKLAGLLWPDMPESAARNNLRRTLANVRQVIGDREAESPFLNVSRQAVQADPAAGAWTDAVAFGQLLARDPDSDRSADTLEQAVALYGGSFLEGFSLAESAAFEEWLLFKREQLHRQAAEALEALSADYEGRGDHKTALGYAWRQVELDPWREEAHQQVMRLLALSGQRAAALAQYETCRQMLADELGVEPSPETQALYRQVQAGELAVTAAGRRTVRGYELQERVGSGGFGVVYRAFQPAVGRAVAVKVILPEYANQAEFVRRFEREAQLVARLEHPHIVPLYDYWREAEGAYLVMRWLGGGDLGRALQRGPWSLEAAARLLGQVADGLAFAHERAVVHRDIKPENILLDEQGNAYISDFGIAKVVMAPHQGKVLMAPHQGKVLVRVAETTKDGAVRGSLWYIAPEQAQSQRVTPQTDLYSLGIVMFEILAGEHPYAGLAPGEQLVRRLTEPLPSLRTRQPGLPPALDGVLGRATAANPGERYPDAPAFANAFRVAMEEASAAGAPATPDLTREPAFLHPEAEPVERPRPVFVAREPELARLDAFLDAALAGRGQVAFVTGGAGRGKTALMEAFRSRAMAAHPDLLVAAGSCNAHSGLGDPYLPFRELLGTLTGDVEAQWAAGAITREHALRLWSGAPQAIQALAQHGPHLVGGFLPAGPLLARARTLGVSELERVAERTARPGLGASGLERSHLFEQVTRSLGVLAQSHPLLLLLDDLQWADAASISLLFHLGRRLEGSRILIVAAYRPSEVALGHPATPRQARDDAGSGSLERHPLDKVLGEFKRTYGDVWVDLAQMDETRGARFVDAFLDAQPHRLGEGFRRALARHTGGHALFTVELWRALQERGDLTQDEDGRWIEGPALDWDALPARVEGVIENRVGQLSPELRELLALASVEGETFTAQVLARMQGVGERELLRGLTRDLERRHRLVRERGEITVGGQRLSRFQFTHTLFQRYLYQGLGSGERRLLHREVAQVLEELYAGESGEIAVSLARHFQLGGAPERAVDYMLQAGDQARALYAHAEAEGHYTQAVSLLREEGDAERAARTLMKLGLVYTAAFEPHQARDAYAEAFRLWEPLRESAPKPGPAAQSAALRLALEQPLTLDPGMVADDGSKFVAAQLYEGLVRIGRDYNVLPAAASRWEVTDDGTLYTFYLRTDARWSDGAPLTAADFEFAWKRVLGPASGSSQAHLLFVIKNARAFRDGTVKDPGAVGVRAVDKHTLEVSLASPTAYLPHLLAHPVAYPLPRGAGERGGEVCEEATVCIGNGPYELVEWARGERMVLKKNPFYRGPFPGNVERVECAVLTEFGAALDAYAAGEMDAVSLINAEPHAVARAREAFGDELVAIPQPSLLYVMFRADRPPFDDAQVRRAFVHAVDREQMVSEAFGDRRLPASGGFVPPGMAGHSPGIGLAYAPDQARRLLAQGGYPGGRGFPAVAWVHAPSGTDQRVIPFLRRSWQRNLGVEVESQTLDFRDLMASLAGDMAHLTMIGWSAGYPDPDNMLRATFHSQQGLSNPRWRDARFDELVERAGRVTDHEARMALYREADRILVTEEVVIMPLTYGQGRLLVKPWVRLPHSPSVSMPLQSVVVERRPE
jgi:ABC-type oligopeptide transport system substrate-binding subunit/serine/threonine protein kinase/predicted ATPase